MVDEIDTRILDIISASNEPLTVTQVLDALLDIYGEAYGRARIRNRLNCLVRYRFIAARDATMSIRGKPTRFYESMEESQ